MTILKAFGQRAKEILHMVQSMASCAQTCNTYVEDTLNSVGQADHDIDLTIAHLEDALRDLKELRGKIAAARLAAQPLNRIPVHAIGH